MTTTIEPEQVASAETPREAPAQPEIARKKSEPWAVLSLLVVLGGLSSMAYYLGFVQPYPLAGNYKTPLLDLAKLNGAAGSAANSWAFTWIVVFACYVMAFRFCPPAADVTRTFRRVALFIIVGWAAFFSINLFFMYPVGAADLFDQIFRARLLSHYGLNPFTTLPSRIVGDPLQAYVAWKGDPSPYGPVWELLAAGTSLVAGSDLWQNLVSFKLLVIAAYGVSIALTYLILRAYRPDWALRGTLFFAWNPLVVFEVAGNGHNDAIVIMFVLLGVYLFVTARRVGVIPAIMAGALAKFVPVLLIPIFAAAIWRDRVAKPMQKDASTLPVRRRLLSNFDVISILAIGGVLALGMAMVLYAPFWTGPDSIGALSRKKLFTASIPKVALDLLTLRFHVSDSTAQWLVRNGALGLTLLITLGLTLWVFLKGNARNEAERSALIDRTLSSAYEVIFFYLAFATLWFQPWYLMWLVALTAPVARMANANRTIFFCIGGVANYFVWDFIWLWNQVDISVIQTTSALSIYTLPLLYSLYIWVRPLVERLVGRGTGDGRGPAPVMLES
jgi:hypothetical protein